jgi:hypothetical protein
MTEKDSNAQSHDQSPISNLSDLKRRLANAQPVIVDQDGQLRAPEDPQVSGKPIQSKTVLRPQRWFAYTA